VTDERRAQQLLDALDRERAPRPEFERVLHDVLFGTETVETGEAAASDDANVIDLEPTTAGTRQKRRRSPAQVVLAAAVVATLAIGTLVAVTQLAGDDGDVATRTGSEIEQLATDACTRFQQDAFATVSRADLLGPEREPTFQDPLTSRRALNELTRALDNLSAELRSAGLSDPELMRHLDIARNQAAAAAKRLEPGQATEAAKSAVGRIDTDLLNAQRRLIALGVTQCL
jgi:hypothetical protein